jgi:hypothetical protein
VRAAAQWAAPIRHVGVRRREGEAGAKGGGCRAESFHWLVCIRLEEYWRGPQGQEGPKGSAGPGRTLRWGGRSALCALRLAPNGKGGGFRRGVTLPSIIELEH